MKTFPELRFVANVLMDQVWASANVSEVRDQVFAAAAVATVAETSTRKIAKVCPQEKPKIVFVKTFKTGST